MVTRSARKALSFAIRGMVFGKVDAAEGKCLNVGGDAFEPIVTMLFGLKRRILLFQN